MNTITDVIVSKEIGGNVVNIVIDADAPKPEAHFGTIYYVSNRYTLGHERLDADEIRRIEKSDDYVVLPVYAYIHGGVALSTKSFRGKLPQGHAEFDSGKCGIIAVSKEEIRNRAGVKRVTRKVREQIEIVLKAQVEEFSLWANGECFGYVIERPDGTEDSCFGFYGLDDALEAAESDI